MATYTGLQPSSPTQPCLTWYAASPHFTLNCRTFKNTRCAQDGTLTDSIAAVEAAWTRVAREIGADPVFVIAATHGKRAIDNLARFKPHLRPHELGAAVDDFERSILFYADAYARTRAGSGAAGSSTPPLLSDAGSAPSSTESSCVSSPVQSALSSTEQLVVVLGPQPEVANGLAAALSAVALQERKRESEREWEVEAAQVDRAVRALPGVKALLASIPEGRYAIATSGAETYGALLHSLPVLWFQSRLSYETLINVSFVQRMAVFLEWASPRPK
jgi:beta-phosphoglucomutase-like phosphatase (HAD superfamily)